MTDAGVLSCDNVHKHFEDAGQRLDVLKGVDLKVGPGETVAIVGASGSGKTTLLQILGGLDLPSIGHVRIDGRRIDELSDAERGRLRNQHSVSSTSSTIYCRNSPRSRTWRCRCWCAACRRLRRPLRRAKSSNASGRRATHAPSSAAFSAASGSARQ